MSLSAIAYSCSRPTAELGRFYLKAQFTPELKFCFQPTAYILANPYLAKVRMTSCDAKHALFIEADQRMLSSVEDWNRANPFSITAWGNSQINLWWSNELPIALAYSTGTHAGDYPVNTRNSRRRDERCRRRIRLEDPPRS